MSESTQATAPEKPAPPASAGEAWRRLFVRRDPGSRRGQLTVAVLCGVLGFALATQVHANRGSEGSLASARQDDLVGILANLGDRSDRLHDEITDLQHTRDQLAAGPGSAAAAVRAARERARTLGILAGTLPVRGPGIELTIRDPQGAVRASLLLDTLEELRDAGAEAIAISGARPGVSGGGHSGRTVRVVASTYLLDGAPGSVRIDGTTLRAPYTFTVIGEPRTLAAALAIPGGVLESLGRSNGASGAVHPSRRLTILALRPLSPPQYARPTSDRSG
jgi:uncharacterized protein YlxW (UPF0749 family)